MHQFLKTPTLVGGAKKDAKIAPYTSTKSASHHPPTHKLSWRGALGGWGPGARAERGGRGNTARKKINLGPNSSSNQRIMKNFKVQVGAQ